jgi:glycosyltransferase involved in cell wall biosynthesis
MRILAIEPYYGGSHKAFLTGWSTRSRHAWTVLDLPAHKWKWRMRHGAITLADRVRAEAQQGGRWDLVFCSDMLNLAEFRGLAVDAVRTLPCVVYFHENQLTYPVRHESERDYHFVLTNMTTALAADRVWFNSAFHRDSFVNGLPGFLRRMPDHQQLDAADRIRVKSDVCYPGIETWPRRAHRRPGPLHIVWAGRWEHDKNPETFFSALDRLRATGTAFRVSVVGEQFRESPPIFDRARTQLSEHIEHWGYQADRHVYEQLLADADVFVSTASQEFFGLSVVEAVAAGCYPLLPRRLAYPELFASAGIEDPEPFFYDGSTEDLAHQLQRLAHRIQTQGCVSPEALAERFTARYGWDTLADTYDEAIEKHRR